MRIGWLFAGLGKAGAAHGLNSLVCVPNWRWLHDCGRGRRELSPHYPSSQNNVTLK